MIILLNTVFSSTTGLTHTHNTSTAQYSLYELRYHTIYIRARDGASDCANDGANDGTERRCVSDGV